MLLKKLRVYRVEITDGQCEIKLKNQAHLFDLVTIQAGFVSDSGTGNMVKWVRNIDGNDLNIAFFVMNSLDPNNAVSTYNGIIDIWIGINDVKINTITLSPSTYTIDNF